MERGEFCRFVQRNKTLESETFWELSERSLHIIPILAALDLCESSRTLETKRAGKRERSEEFRQNIYLAIQSSIDPTVIG